MYLLHENEAALYFGEKADTQVGVFQYRTWDGQAGALRRVETVQVNSRTENSESVFEALCMLRIEFSGYLPRL